MVLPNLVDLYVGKLVNRYLDCMFEHLHYSQALAPSLKADSHFESDPDIGSYATILFSDLVGIGRPQRQGVDQMIKH